MTKKNGSGAVRVLVAAESAVRRAGLEAIVRSTPRLKLVGSVHASGLSAQARAFQPDVIVADLDRPDSQSMATVSAVGGSGAAVVTLVDAPSPAWTAHALRAGVRAILPRDVPAEEIFAAIRSAHAGLVLMDAAVTQDLAGHLHVEPPDSASEAFDELTTREIEVLRMLADGLGNKQIAAGLGISNHTVKFHISSILDKLGASSRTEAVTLGIRMGLILI
jgi:two-component system, NarL family, response regulator YdfI